MLKIFFGYAAGVGKTYAMLEAAQKAHAEGADVVIGYIEPHTRPQTLALTAGLETISPMLVPHGGATLRELDLDAAIARKPQLLLVDELAHSNAPSCRNQKRYQDIRELLHAGIDVYTTVNVQHIESLHDIVQSITGVAVSERVPDPFIDEADQVELVDIEPEELLERLRAGKIYRSEQAGRAMQNFFVAENLIALREIALRRVADQINRRSDVIRGSSTREFYTNEHILICLSPSPSNAKVIRAAARMSEALHGSFTALYVERPGTADLSGENLDQLRRNLKLAEQLGAHIATVYGDSVPQQIADYARATEVSKIIIGRSNNRRGLFSKPTFVEQLTRIAPNLDVYIIPDNRARYQPPKATPRITVPVITPGESLKAAMILLLSSLLGLVMWNLELGETNIILCYILGVLLTSVCTQGRFYSLTSSVLSVLVFNFLFTEPRFSLQAYDPGYPVTFAIMFGVAILTSTLTTRLKDLARLAAQKAGRTEILLETSQKLQKATTRLQLLEVAGNQMHKLANHPVLLYPCDADGSLVSEPLVFGCSATEATPYLSLQERAVAEWVLRNNKSAGAGTHTLPQARTLCLAVRGSETVCAVVSIAQDGDLMPAYEKNLLLALLGEFGLSLEKEAMREAQQKTQLLAEAEALRAQLLRAISHDLRTPLTAISGNASILLANNELLDQAKLLQLYSDIYDDSLWLINLVENLLALTRFDNPDMQLRTQPELLDEVFCEAKRHVSRRSEQYTLHTRLADELLMAEMDAHLIIQVLINLVDNAIKYTPPGSVIELRCYRRDYEVVVEVADNGPGIADSDKERIFDMFYTASGNSDDSRRGLGLGLSLCRSVVEAHGGQITVGDNKPHGAVFAFTLPAKEVLANGN